MRTQLCSTLKWMRGPILLLLCRLTYGTIENNFNCNHPQATWATVLILLLCGMWCHSGFHLDPELASRDEGAPQEGRTRGAVLCSKGDRSYRHHDPPLTVLRI
jgi:hypothetical protein